MMPVDLHLFLWGLLCYVGLIDGIALVLAGISQDQAELVLHSQMLSPLYGLDTWTAHLLD